MSTNKEEQGQLPRGQAPNPFAKMVSGDDAESLDSRVEEAVQVTFDNLVNGLAREKQQHANEAKKQKID